MFYGEKRNHSVIFSKTEINKNYLKGVVQENIQTYTRGS